MIIDLDTVTINNPIKWMHSKNNITFTTSNQMTFPSHIHTPIPAEMKEQQDRPRLAEL